MTPVDPIEHTRTQRLDWSRAAPGWEKWDAWLRRATAPLDRLLLEWAGVRTGHRVLDLGSGTGYPALGAARAVAPGGFVLGIDLAEPMLRVAGRKAAAAGIQRVHFAIADAAALPVGSSVFDAATSRFCLMFLAEPEKGLREIHRVLRPGGRLAAAVWASADKNPALASPTAIVRRFFDLPPPDPSEPGMFRFGGPNDLKHRLEAAGFRETREEELPIAWRYASVREYLQSLRDMAAPLRALLDQLDAEALQRVEAELVRFAEGFKKDGEIVMPAVARVVSATRPDG